MAKTILPAISIGTHGSVNPNFHYRRSPSGIVACVTTVPANPQTTQQQTHRHDFSSSSSFWKFIKQHPADLSAWETRRKFFDKRRTPYSEFLHSYASDPYPGYKNHFYIKDIIFSDISLHEPVFPGDPLSLTFTLSLDIYYELWSSQAVLNLGNYPFTALITDEVIAGDPFAWNHLSTPLVYDWQFNYFYFWFSSRGTAFPSSCHSGLYYLHDIPLIL